jgi:hypothetical protein
LVAPLRFPHIAVVATGIANGLERNVPV